MVILSRPLVDNLPSALTTLFKSSLLNTLDKTADMKFLLSAVFIMPSSFATSKFKTSCVRLSASTFACSVAESELIDDSFAFRVNSNLSTSVSLSRTSTGLSGRLVASMPYSLALSIIKFLYPSAVPNWYASFIPSVLPLPLSTTLSEPTIGAPSETFVLSANLEGFIFLAI